MVSLTLGMEMPSEGDFDVLNSTGGLADGACRAASALVANGANVTLDAIPDRLTHNFTGKEAGIALDRNGSASLLTRNPELPVERPTTATEPAVDKIDPAISKMGLGG